MITAISNVINCRRQIFVTVDWTIQGRAKRVTLKIANIKYWKAISELESEEIGKIEVVSNDSQENENSFSVD